MVALVAASLTLPYSAIEDLLEEVDKHLGTLPLPLPGDPRGRVHAAVLQLDEEPGHQVADGRLGWEEVEDGSAGADVAG